MRHKFTAPLLSLLLLSVSYQAAAAPTPATVGVDLAGRDLSVKPGDDFNAYANGGWSKTTEIPADRSSTGIFVEVARKAEQRNAALMQELSKTKAPAGTPERLIADYYAAFIDTPGIEKKGLAPLEPELTAIQAIRSKADLATALGKGLRADVDPMNATNYWTQNLFGLFVTQSLSDPDKTIPYLLQGGLGVPDREYLLSSDEHLSKVRDAYRAYVENILKLAGIADASAKADRIVALETKIATAHVPRSETDDVHKASTVWSTADLNAKAPGLDWARYLDAAGLSAQPVIDPWQPEAIKGLSALVASEPLDAWKDWMTFHAINRAAPYLSQAFVDARFDFYGKTLSGTPQQRPRDKQGIANVNADLGDAMGQLYVARYFPASSKAEVQKMVSNILAAFNRRVDALEWMTPATKAKAKAKIATLKVGVGYPESWRDYAGLDIRADDALGNARRADEYEYRHQLAKLGKPVDRGEWWLVPQTVNAVNLPLQNALNFPAAILEAPFFDPAADAAANYGSIGGVIGHEISHSFDNVGAEFDANGKLENWWTPEDLAHFKDSGKQLADQFDAYEPLPGAHVNGEQTLGENIADVAGLAAAYDAYRLSLGGKEAPVIGGLTGDQRFFLAFAQSWRTKTRDAALRQQLLTDGHAPGQVRAQTVRNLDAWYKAFGIKPGDSMYLPPEKRVRVW